MSFAVGFRPLQASHDLVHLARQAPLSTLRRIAAGVPTADMAQDDALRALAALVHQDRCRLVAGRTLPLHETLLLAATLPDEDFEAFVLATMILLADRLQGGAGPDDLYWHWDANAEHYLTAGPVERAAVLRGFHGLAEAGRLPAGSIHLQATSGVDLGRVRPDLRAIAEGAPDNVLSAIAAADYGDRAAEHLSALRDVIAAQGSVLLPGQAWTPSEVLELASHDPAHPGHLVATVVLLVTALSRGDEQGWFSYRWEQQALAYERLEPAARWAVLSGIRHLYETDPAFQPYPQALFDPTDHRARLIPLLTIADRPHASR
ncbi:hypothetical protein ACRDNQ_08690 [Palleronia sp. KMU-117]|uniref:hypothetical protein n=1 Tax=Palleronia sp. KMU-117 TaxID=3434108 RepID=UPI003D733AFD